MIHPPAIPAGIGRSKVSKYDELTAALDAAGLAGRFGHGARIAICAHLADRERVTGGPVALDALALANEYDEDTIPMYGAIEQGDAELIVELPDGDALYWHNPTAQREYARCKARAMFDEAINAETDPDRVARLEVLREYVTDPAFRRTFEDFVFAATYVGAP